MAAKASMGFFAFCKGPARFSRSVLWRSLVLQDYVPLGTYGSMDGW
jgi:hypothetical protein